MLDEARSGIIDPGCQEVYCDGSVQVVDEDMVHSTLYVVRGSDKIAVMVVHMTKRKHAENVRRIFAAVCTACTSRALQTFVVTLMGG